MLIDLPDPALVVLVGAAGAGKSTFAARWFEPTEVVSSDELRAAIGGDPTNQAVTRRAFAILHREVARRLAAGNLVVVDATSVERSARSALRRLAAVAGVRTVAIVLAPPPDIVHGRNAERPGRTVPVEVVERQLRLVDRLGPSPADVAAALASEGFAAVHVVAADVRVEGVIRHRTPGGG